MKITRVSDPEEIFHVLPIVKSAWGMEDTGQLVKDLLTAMNFHGGLVLLAWNDNEPIGMHFSFPGKYNGRSYLYSHMTGVREGLKSSGIGYDLKMKQKEWALNNGYDLIVWTFDPLMSVNAHFNFRKLGVISRSYRRNFYGTMDDSLNRGLPTDRFIVEWWIKRTKPSYKNPDLVIDPQEDAKIPAEPAASLMVKIPRDFRKLKAADIKLAGEIRARSRETFEKLFNSGYAAVDFIRDSSSYVFVKDPALDEHYGERIF
ncbi:hypothetical protein ApAK_06935 [Thermoplasmatales archaeon AK]|nr:hypothetical protein [Thermoplasmatales archaeon AK]